MKIISEFGVIDIIDEGAYSFGSSDNLRRYELEKNLSGEYKPSSIHGILLNGKPLAVFGASGGATVVHENSAIVVNGNLYLAVGDQCVCLTLNPFEFGWATQTDMATCFGIYYEPGRSALLSHGELEIARLSFDGQIVWTSSGADIFSGGFVLLPGYIQVTDFNGTIYRFDYENGEEIV